MRSAGWVTRRGWKAAIVGLGSREGGFAGYGDAGPATCIVDPSGEAAPARCIEVLKSRFETGGSGGGGSACLHFPVTPAGVGVAGNASVLKSGIYLALALSPWLKT